MAKFIPVIGEIYTSVESGILAASAGLAKVCGDDKAANELIQGAGNAWKEYRDGNLLATPIYGMTLDIKGDAESRKKSDELLEKYKKSFESTVDGMPVVGHVKGVVHYIAGDTEKGNQCMESATRTAAVVGAGVATGGVGLGVVAGVGAGITAGAAYDGVATGIDHAVNGDKAKTHGNLRAFDKDASPNEVAQGLMGFGLDGMAGAGGNRMGKNLRNRAIRAAGEKKLNDMYKDAGVKDPKGATRQTVDTARQAEANHAALKNKTQGCTTTVKDKSSGKSASGNSRRIRQQERIDSGRYPSKTQARRITKDNVSHLQEAHPEVQQVSNRPQTSCAEHPAFTEFNENNPGYNPDHVRTTTVFHKDGVSEAMPRCDNCKAYGSAMGEVVTDLLPQGTKVPTIKIGSTVGAVVATVAGVAFDLRAESEHEDYETDSEHKDKETESEHED